jgi:hypothetical protein
MKTNASFQEKYRRIKNQNTFFTEFKLKMWFYSFNIYYNITIWLGRITSLYYIFIIFLYCVITVNNEILILWHVDPLLGNVREISKYTAAVAK